MDQILKQDIDLSIWSDDFIQLTSKMIDFQLASKPPGAVAFYFARSTWLRGFNSVVNSATPLEPSNLFGMVFYALEFVTSRDLGDGIRDAYPMTMLDEVSNIIHLVHRKNKDYGNSALQSPVLLPWLDVRCALLVRLSDKVQRVRNLIFENTTEISETVFDTLRDLVGYVFLIWSVIRTQEEEKRREHQEKQGGQEDNEDGEV